MKNNKEMINKDNINEEAEHKKLHFILNKINHKPLIMEHIYSFAKNRPYILLHLISNDDLLKTSLKNTFDNSLKENNLSREINININDYILYRKINEKLGQCYLELKSNILENNKKLNSII